MGVWVGTPTGNADQSNTGRNRALTIASAIADTLPETDTIIPWRSIPITEGQAPQQAPKIVYPSNGSRLVLLQAPIHSRQLQLTLTGDASDTAVYLNDQKVELTGDMLIPIPYDGFYDLEIRKGPVALEKVSFAVLSAG